MSKSNKEEGVFYHIKRENIDMYNFLRPQDITEKLHIVKEEAHGEREVEERLMKRENIDERKENENIDDSEKYREKERKYILKEIRFYSSLPNYTPRNIYNKINTIMVNRFKYEIPYINSCSLCNINIVHTIHYDNSMRIDNKPIVFMTPGNAIDNSKYYLVQHLIIELDKCIEDIINIDIDTTKFSIVFNFENYTLGKMIKDMGLAYELSLILHDLYYDRVEYIYLIDAPLFMTPMLSMMKKMFKNSIYKKIVRISKYDYEGLINYK